jgi:hypothetical protein
MKIPRGLIPTLIILLVSPATAYLQSPEVVISEIAWMGTTNSPSDEWIELYNNTSSSMPLTGWTLTASDGTPNIALSGSIPANEHYLLVLFC